MKRNNNLKFITAILGVCFILGCSQSGLDIGTPGITPEAVPANAKDASAMVTGCYSKFMENERGDWYYTYSTYHILTEVCSDDTYKGGDSHGDQAWMEELGYFRTGYNQGIDVKWGIPWAAIRLCNDAINKIPSVKGLELKLMKRLVAEAKFLRAFWYFELIRNFGDVPVITKSITASDFNQPRVSSKEVCETLIEKDLQEAVSTLPQKREYAAADAGRATRGAALALSAKVFLYEKKWQPAFDNAKKIVDEGQYTLEADYRKIFESDNVNGSESVFEIAYSNNGTYQYGFAGAHALHSRDDGGWGWMQPSTDLDREFEVNDPRRNQTIIHDGDTNIEGYTGPYKVRASSNNQVPYTASHKYYIQASKRNNGQSLQIPYNLQVIRYADVLLMYAEAALQIGNQDQADQAVEQVRARARKMTGVPPGTLPAKTNVKMDDIIHERRVELATEGHRFYDLKRWGIAAKVLNALPAKIATYPESAYIGAKGALYQSPRNDVFAIPTADVASAGWKQNQGY